MALPISVSREEAATSCAPAAAASVTVLTRATPAQTMTCPAALFPSRRISGTYRHAVTKATRAATRTSRRPRLAFGESFARTPGVVTVLGLIRGCISGIAVTSSRPIGCWPRIVDTAVRFSLNAGAVVDTEQEEPRDQCDAMRCDAMLTSIHSSDLVPATWCQAISPNNSEQHDFSHAIATTGPTKVKRPQDCSRLSQPGKAPAPASRAAGRQSTCRPPGDRIGRSGLSGRRTGAARRTRSSR